MSYVVPVKSKVKISQNFVAFSRYLNFVFLRIIYLERCWDSTINEEIDGWIENHKHSCKIIQSVKWDCWQISHFIFHTFNYEIGIDNFDNCGYKSWKIEHCKASNNADGHVCCPNFFWVPFIFWAISLKIWKKK